MPMKQELEQSIGLVGRFAERAVWRILTQVCRDPDSRCYGSFDRAWWHYKIRDFPSIILQQGGYSLWLAGKLDAFRDMETWLRRLAAASALFWNKRAVKQGAFEEYYPWEQGYAPVAFSTLSVLKLASEGVVSSEEIESGVAKAASQLLARFESRAANQQVAGLAALALVRLLYPHLLCIGDFERMSRMTLALQRQEGWFEEYGGPDLGYLSVAIDCLWDLFDVTKDVRYLEAAKKALEFLSSFVWLPSRGAGMHNARNTDYIVPYGIVRFMKQPGRISQLSANVLARLFNREKGYHFLDVIDDRYYCHYIGHSLIRASFELKELADSYKEQSVFEVVRPSEVFLRQSGHYLRYKKSKSDWAAIISLKKGGVFTLWCSDGYACDFGWVVKKGARQWSSHWWSKDWQTERREDGFRVAGWMVAHTEIVSTPWRHFFLRVASFLMGRRLICFLKERFIFKESGPKGPRFEREIVFKGGQVLVRDRILDLPAGVDVVRASRFSKRYVASADSFHREDVALIDGLRKEQESCFLERDFTATTTYFFAAEGNNKQTC